MTIIGSAKGFDSPAQSVPAKGSTVGPWNGRPGTGYEVLFGVRGAKAGMYKFKSVRVQYRVGGNRYVLSSNDRVWFCVGVDSC
ncbi:hypothetical protein [Paractinoplanes globisporus]|uniref:Uncharacterized protein n=1 Tax=Paractinoplanes globisporus TaxID=113565 RepID=A0ABW6WSE0_9ACTN|nr:hypothetical protein [Actinoplanes globisporus]